MEVIRKTHIPLSMGSSSQFLFDIFTKDTCTTKKRLMIYVQTVEDAYKSFEGTDVAIIKFDFSVADALKNPISISILIDAILSGLTEHPIEQQKIRTRTKDQVSTEKSQKWNLIGFYGLSTIVKIVIE